MSSSLPDPRQLSIHDYTYQLPPERIAPEPLAQRDQSQLLLSRQGAIEDRTFHELPAVLPADSLLVFNDTKVVRARLFCHKPTGGQIELFCLEPVAPHRALEPAMQQTGSCVWKCLVGNGKRWKTGPVLLEFEALGAPATLTAERLEATAEGYSLIQFSWEPAALPFAEVLRGAGHLPLPPYLNRDDTAVDAVRYQTVYAAHEGAVAAPTAGLHFSEAVLAELAERGHQQVRVTLHVGAGTFQPVKADRMDGHAMHGEPISVSRAVLEQLLHHAPRPIIAVGTTSLRTLESLYWLGVQAAQGLLPTDATPHVGQWQPYEPGSDLPTAAALHALLHHLDTQQQDTLHATTQLLIAPGYRFRLIQGLVTNFHQPESTLLLLVAALIGPGWRRVYDHALASGYRFLSYGDSSLLLP
ncbi:S-adenosylmethionine:tRNA ribosyltransferase-isomerase [Hymenobacter canadensis]|uniref:S-adenosylmethionine:tRNA ribosyltransferase-isomerase n=1 Tax=Hymenobacter canadensis TaxID=2999067 RepID=A0ABY7LNA5_9BACT|nr:S-adenosylmethionine:tRNA ribosyltransferase-isomerase [Hymenobacter canadensis]WBA40200.1 S-adenosylmethionine:tRNA ribosyltransferase-isomerase [Hymenobacter canadensis]